MGVGSIWRSQMLNGLFTYIWVVSKVNVGKYTIHWASGDAKHTLPKFKMISSPLKNESRETTEQFSGKVVTFFLGELLNFGG